MDKKKLNVKTTIQAPVEKVWQAYNEPGHIVNWNFASEDWHCPAAESDLKPGGKYKARMEAKDGSFGFDFEAVYDEVINHQKIAYTMPDGRKAVTDFETSGSSTVISTTFDSEDQNPMEMQQEGWQAILNNFKKYVETNF